MKFLYFCFVFTYLLYLNPPLILKMFQYILNRRWYVVRRVFFIHCWNILKSHSSQEIDHKIQNVSKNSVISVLTELRINLLLSPLCVKKTKQGRSESNTDFLKYHISHSVSVTQPGLTVSLWPHCSPTTTKAWVWPVGGGWGPAQAEDRHRLTVTDCAATIKKLNN